MVRLATSLDIVVTEATRDLEQSSLTVVTFDAPRLCCNCICFFQQLQIYKFALTLALLEQYVPWVPKTPPYLVSAGFLDMCIESKGHTPVKIKYPKFLKDQFSTHCHWCYHTTLDQRSVLYWRTSFFSGSTLFQSVISSIGPNIFIDASTFPSLRNISCNIFL